MLKREGVSLEYYIKLIYPTALNLWLSQQEYKAAQTIYFIVENFCLLGYWLVDNFVSLSLCLSHSLARRILVGFVIVLIFYFAFFMLSGCPHVRLMLAPFGCAHFS